MNQTPKEIAIALAYDESQPKVLHQGMGQDAEQILKTAKALGIPISEDSSLAEALSQIGSAEQIPESLYMALAEVLAWAFYVDGKVPD